MKHAENRIPPSLGEKHHVFPKSLFGKNTRVVKLTYMEHVIAHKMLWLGCRQRYGDSHKNTIKMAKAYYSTTRNGHATDEEAALARKAHALSMSGKNNPMFGKPGTFLGKKHSEESKALLKKTKSKNRHLLLKASSMGGKTVQSKRSAEERKLFAAKAGAATRGISKAVGYRWFNNGVIEKKLQEQPIGWSIGRIKFSAESSLKKSIATKGRKFRSVTCQHCGKTGAIPVMSRFHFDFCKERS